jgi:hypothetical protein
MLNKNRRVIMLCRSGCILVGLVLVGICSQSPVLHAEDLSTAATPAVKIDQHVTLALFMAPSHAGDSFVTLARSDPVGAFRAGLASYEARVRDYTCTFEKQERVGGRMRTRQLTQVRFREKPFSVNMLWLENEDKARRVIYVEGRWTNKHGEKLAVVEPAGSIARVFVNDVLRPIDGDEARAASRKPIDQFGFANTLRRILKICDLANKRKELDIRYVGESTLAGRPTYMFERRLPYTDESGLYPDRLLIVHLDKEYLLPTSCASYADEARTTLLGRYVITDVRFNVGLTNRDFARKGE